MSSKPVTRSDTRAAKDADDQKKNGDRYVSAIGWPQAVKQFKKRRSVYEHLLFVTLLPLSFDAIHDVFDRNCARLFNRAFDIATPDGRAKYELHMETLTEHIYIRDHLACLIADCIKHGFLRRVVVTNAIPSSSSSSS